MESPFKVIYWSGKNIRDYQALRANMQIFVAVFRVPDEFKPNKVGSYNINVVLPFLGKKAFGECVADSYK